jgi:hypothetical protein
VIQLNKIDEETDEYILAEEDPDQQAKNNA